MTTTISSYEAKSKWSDVMKRVKKGEAFIVTHRGEKVADIRPVLRPKMTVQEAVDRIRRRWEEGRAKNPAPRESISRAELHEGHKY